MIKSFKETDFSLYIIHKLIIFVFICSPLLYLSLASRRGRVTPRVEIQVMANNRTSNVRKTCSSIQSHFVVFPQGDGKLPIWQIAVAVTAVFNTVQNFITLSLTKRLYNAVPATQPGISHPTSRCLGGPDSVL